MADSYAQLALSKHRSKGSCPQHAGAATGAVDLADLEDKVLDLAKLLRACQLQHEKTASDQGQAVEQLSAKVMQLEEYLQSQIPLLVAPVSPGVQALKVLSDRLMLLEGQLNEGLQENHSVHLHNAEVIMRMEERITKLEKQFSEEAALRQHATTQLVAGLVESRLDAFENEIQARLMLAASTLEQRAAGPENLGREDAAEAGKEQPQEPRGRPGSLQNASRADGAISPRTQGIMLGGKENRNDSKVPLPSAQKDNTRTNQQAARLPSDNESHLKRLRKLKAELL